MIGAVSYENEAIINKLIALKANVNLVVNQLTALSHAAQSGLPDICKILLSHGAKLELGHIHPVILLIKNYDNLNNKEKALDTFHVLIYHTDKQFYEDIMMHVFIEDNLELFRYILVDSCIPVEQRNNFATSLLTTKNCSHTIRDFLKSKQFFDNLNKQLVEKDETLSKAVKIYYIHQNF